MSGRILVVEDNLITSEVITHRLKKRGYTVAGVLTTGEEAVAWMQSNEADLILMDVQLDGLMDGIEAAFLIRGHSTVPIVYLTANSDLSTISRASGTTASGYITKPFDDTALHSTIQMALGRRSVDADTADDRDRVVRTLAALAQPIIAMDAAGTVTSINSLAEALTGCASQTAIGEDISRILDSVDEQGQHVTHAIPTLFLTADLTPIRQAVTVISANGERRAMQQVASPILDGANRMMGIVLAFEEPRGSN